MCWLKSTLIKNLSILACKCLATGGLGLGFGVVLVDGVSGGAGLMSISLSVMLGAADRGGVLQQGEPKSLIWDVTLS